MLVAEVTYGHWLVLPSQLQPPPRAPQSAPAKVDIPSMVKPAREAGKAREVGVQEASHVYVHEGAVQTAGRHILRPIPRAGSTERKKPYLGTVNLKSNFR